MQYTQQQPVQPQPAQPYWPYGIWPHFYTNPTIAYLGHKQKWTISTQNDVRVDPNDENSKLIYAKKMPVDAQELRRSGRVVGARIANMQETLVTLDDLAAFLPNAANCAFYLNWKFDQVIIVDIESTCPPETRDRLLTLLPYALYAEVSMSGRGYHIILPAPPETLIDPYVQNKKVIKDPNGYFEILLEHWVTFTRTPIPQEIVDNAAHHPQPLDPYTFWNECVAQAKQQHADSGYTDLDIDMSTVLSDDPKVAYYEQQIINRAHNICLKMPSSKKTLADFNNDTSRFEFSTLMRAANAIGEVLYLDALDQWSESNSHNPPPTGVDLEQTSRLTYLLGVHILPHREKHDGTRNGMPYLAQRALDAVSHIDWDVTNAKTRARYLHGKL